VINKYGADILRLWVVTSDYHGDLRIGEAILQQNSDIYRRFRNTIRYILGALHNYEPSSDLKLVDDLELYILAKLHLLEEKYQNCQASYNYTDFYHSLHDFCSRTLSGFYFDVRKDSLYCDAVDSDRRQQTCHLLHITITLLLKWLSPVLVFTVQDIRDNYWHMADATLPDMADPASVVNKWQNILRFRADVMLRLEQKRAEKLIGSSLEACVTIGRDVDVPAYDDWATLCIVSDFIRSEHSDDIKVEVASGYKCDRCWKVTNKQGLCQRCEDAISG
jgi:isoleucyl-tRNA synthetase